jgi:twinfilin
MILAEEAMSVSPADLASQISATEPRYTFYRHTFSGDDGTRNPVIFIYTCPTPTKVKDRMLYASSRRSAEALASQEAGLILSKRASQFQTHCIGRETWNRADEADFE